MRNSAKQIHYRYWWWLESKDKMMEKGYVTLRLPRGLAIRISTAVECHVCVVSIVHLWADCWVFSFPLAFHLRETLNPATSIT